MMRGITKGSPELAPSEQRRFWELDERYSKWCELATPAKAEINASQYNIRTARQQREYVWRLVELVKRDTEQLSKFTSELAEILLGHELNESVAPLYERGLTSKPLTVGV